MQESISFLKNGLQKKKCHLGGSYNLEYRPSAIRTDIDENQLLKKRIDLFVDLSRKADKSEETEKSTIGQRDS